MWNAWRPTKMCEEYITMTKEYLETTIDEWEVLKKSSSLSSTWSSESVENKLKVTLPTFAWLVMYFDSKDMYINKDTLTEWNKKWLENSKDKDDLFYRFSVSCKKIMQKQEHMLLNWAVSWRYNPLISKMLLNVNHGYTEVSKSEVEHSWSITSDFKDMTTEQLIQLKNKNSWLEWESE